MLRRFICFQLILLALSSFAGTAYSHDSDVDLDDQRLTIVADDSHDIVLLRRIGDGYSELELLILQFDDPVTPTSLDDIEALVDLADDVREENFDYEDVDFIEIDALGGDDWLLVDPLIEIDCLLIGGDGDDFITSGNGDDIIWGDSVNQFSGFTGGEDRIYGTGGSDYLIGGPWNDELHGGSQNDYLFGGDGDDEMNGGTGDDYLFGGNHNDTMRGGFDRDTMFGESGDDNMDGQSGDDTLFGGADNDVMLGGLGNDLLSGEGGDDELYGESGLDELYGGNDNDYLDGSFDGELDTLVGGSGADVFVNRYFEYRTYTYNVYPSISNQDLSSSSTIIRTTSTRTIRMTTYTVNYQYNFELELVDDFSAADGDSYSPVEVE